MEQLCILRDVYRAIAEFEAVFTNQFYLSLNEGMLLCSLLECEQLSSGELAQKLGLTNSNTSKIIGSVEKKELIHRVMGATDKRQMYFALTEKGQAVIKEIKETSLVLPEVLQQVIDSQACKL